MIDIGLAMDWYKIGNRLAKDWLRIDIGFADWKWLGGLAVDLRIGNGLADWQSIGDGSAYDWEIGRGLA